MRGGNKWTSGRRVAGRNVRQDGRSAEEIPSRRWRRRLSVYGTRESHDSIARKGLRRRRRRRRRNINQRARSRPARTSCAPRKSLLAFSLAGGSRTAKVGPAHEDGEDDDAPDSAVIVASVNVFSFSYSPCPFVAVPPGNLVAKIRHLRILSECKSHSPRSCTEHLYRTQMSRSAMDPGASARVLSSETRNPGVFV